MPVLVVGQGIHYTFNAMPVIEQAVAATPPPCTLLLTAVGARVCDPGQRLGGLPHHLEVIEVWGAGSRPQPPCGFQLGCYRRKELLQLLGATGSTAHLECRENFPDALDTSCHCTRSQENLGLEENGKGCGLG